MDQKKRTRENENAQNSYRKRHKIKSTTQQTLKIRSLLFHFVRIVYSVY